jgi:hypothetical protein
MNPKQWLGVGLMLWGGVGILNQYFNIQALTSGQAPTAALNSADPATVLNIPNPKGAAWTSPGMLADAGVFSVGAYLWKR